MNARLFPSLRAYRGPWLSGDVLAGLTVWAVLAPESLAYASIAGVPPVVGLYAAPGALILYAAFGGSRHLIVGPMSATAALSAAAVAELATQGTDAFLTLTVALTLTAGIVALAAGLLRLGFIASVISEPVLKGFIIGLALTIIAGQLPKLLGIESGGRDFFEKIAHVLRNLGETNAWTLAVGLASLGLVMGLRKFAPRLPGALIAVVLGVAAARAFDLAGHDVLLVGHVESGLPSLGLPDVAAHTYAKLLPSAGAIVLVAFAEGLAAAKVYAAKGHYPIDANQELVGLGAANLGSGVAGGMVVGGSVSKTAVNGAAGGRTQLSGLAAAALTILTLVFLTGFFEDLPEATLGAVVIAAVIELIDVPTLTFLYRLGSEPLRGAAGVAARPDFIGALAALVGVLVFDTLPGLFIGIGVSMLLLVYGASRPHIAVLGRVPGAAEQFTDTARFPENTTFPGVVILRVEGGLFFANSDAIRDRILQEAKQPGVRTVVIDGESSPFMDLTAIKMLEQLTEDLSRDGVDLVLAHEIGGVRDIIARAEREPRIRIYASLTEAVTSMTDIEE